MSGHTAITGFVAPQADRTVLLFRRSKRETWMLTLGGKNVLAVTPGSSFTGFFEPDLCDISATGAHFLYYAIGRDTRHFDTRYKYWTAICRPPYVRALAFFPHHARNGGGGVVDDADTFIVDPGNRPAFDPAEVVAPPGIALAFGAANGPRQCERGWSGDGDTAEKPWGKTTLRRRATASSRKDGFIGGDYAIGDDDYPLDRVSWADIDRQGRLLTASGPVLTVYTTFNRLKQADGKRFDLAELVAAKHGQDS